MPLVAHLQLTRITLDDLFARVLRSTRDGADDFAARYHRKYHFIERLSLDPDHDEADDKYGFNVTCFSKDPVGCAVPTLTPDECAAEGGEVKTVPESFFEFACGDEDAASPIGQVEAGVTFCCSERDSGE